MSSAGRRGKGTQAGKGPGVDVRLLLARGTGAQFRDPRSGGQLLLDVGARGVGDRVGQGLIRRVVELDTNLGSVLLRYLKNAPSEAPGRHRP